MQRNNSTLPYIALIYFLIHEALFANMSSSFNTPLYYASEILIFLVMVFIEKGFTKVIFSRYCMLWLLLVIYQLMNCAYHNVHLENGIMSMAGSLITKFMFLCICTFTFIQDEKRTVIYLCCGYFIYMLLSFNVVSVNADFGGRLRSELMHPNKFAQSVGFGLIFLAYAKYFMNLSYKTIFILSIIPTIAILGCGSRNGLLLYLSYISCFPISKYFNNGINVNKVLNIVIPLIIVYSICYVLLDNTMVGNRLLNTTEQDKSTVFTTGTWLDIFGDRGIYYYIAFQNILEHPFLGIGLYNFQNYNDFPVTVHSEYLIHICEGGLIGGFIYFTFLKLLCNGVISNYKQARTSINIIVIIALISYLFVCLTARAFYYEHFYPILSLCIAKSIISKKNI